MSIGVSCPLTVRNRLLLSFWLWICRFVVGRLCEEAISTTLVAHILFRDRTVGTLTLATGIVVSVGRENDVACASALRTLLAFNSLWIGVHVKIPFGSPGLH